MTAVGDFLANPLVTWVNTFKNGKFIESVSEFADGVFLNEVMVEIDPTYFTLTRIHHNVEGDLNIRIQNLDALVRHLKAYYQEKLQQLILLRAPDVVTIAHDPKSDVSLQELIKILLLMLGCAVQSEKKEDFIEKIKELDFEVQKNLVDCIKEITEKPSNVLTFRVNELVESPLEHIVEYVENMFYQMGQIVEDRDDLVAMVTHLAFEKDALMQERQNMKSPRPFSPPPSVVQQNAKESPSISATKEKIRLLTEEIEEKNVVMQELRDELISNKKLVEKLRQENKQLSQDARWVKAYRDEMDMLKSKADRVEKLEADASKYKDKLRDLEYLRKRSEELKEENELLYDNKLVLEQQLLGLSAKEERIEILEEENKKLKGHIHHIAEERQIDQAKVKEVMEENAQLVIDKQESLAELFSLNAELEVLRGKSSGGPASLASECNESSSMDVLRLSQQNQHLKKSLEDLRGSSARLIDLERENRSLHDKLLQEKSSTHRFNEDLAKYKTKCKSQASEIEKLNRAVHLLREELHVSSSEVLNLSGELKERGEVIAGLEQTNYSQASKISEHSEDVVVKQENVAALTKAVVSKEQQLLNLDQKNKEKEVVILEMNKRIQEKKETITNMEKNISDKDKQLRSLQSRLGESSKDHQKSEETVKKQKKEIMELENRSGSPASFGPSSPAPSNDTSPIPSGASSPAAQRIPASAEREFRELKKEKSKFFKHECHQKNLKGYRERGLVPDGLLLNATPYVSDMTDSFVERWNIILRSASEMLLDLLINHHNEALRSSNQNIQVMENSIREKYNEELSSKILKLGEEIAQKDREKLQEKAQSKLVKRSERFDPKRRESDFSDRSDRPDRQDRQDRPDRQDRSDSRGPGTPFERHADQRRSGKRRSFRRSERSGPANEQDNWERDRHVYDVGRREENSNPHFQRTFVGAGRGRKPPR
ncbi:predicted protein [Nematostella vectensis]|uniref:HOOK N-terminal domain-containing protein n=1 Tax=Nematostella vectensis TaxID=45351 RepID=A7SXP7_NEMVE|nr:predicted protein [Nematostella vectensis]|eukprot:XP_001623630.1 predicted protein [Nematostella vectensis]